MRVQKKDLLRFIRSKEIATFPEVEGFFRSKRFDYIGDTAMRTTNGGPILWYGWTHKAARAFLELYEDRKIFLYRPESSPAPPPRNGKAEIDYDWIPALITSTESW